MVMRTNRLRKDAYWLRVDPDIADPDHDRLHEIADRIDAAVWEIDRLHLLLDKAAQALLAPCHEGLAYEIYEAIERSKL
jgi:hypothetical protein